jgi:hypothetical protein
MKNIFVISTLLMLAAACSGPAKSPTIGGAPSSAPNAAGHPAGEGVTWDNINANPKAAMQQDQDAPQGGPSLLKGNSPPQIKTANLIAGAGSGESIGVAASAVDADGDPVTLEYAWTVNGAPAGNGIRLGRSVRRGDFVTVTITPFDGKDRGRSVTLRSQVNNSPPSIAGIVDVRQEGNLYTGRVQAVDPDGDPIRFALVAGPDGMSIDPVEGTLRWTMPAGFKGKAVFMVSARDRSGGQSTYAGTINVTETFE